MTNGTPKDESDSKEYGRLWSTVGSANVWLVHSLAAMVTVTVVGVLFATGATASTESYDLVMQKDADEGGFLCHADDEPTFLGEILDTLLGFITISAIPVFIILYQLDGLMEFFALGADTKAKIKKHQRNMWIGAAKIFLAPPLLYLVAGSLGVATPECVNIVPWN